MTSPKKRSEQLKKWLGGARLTACTLQQPPALSIVGALLLKSTGAPLLGGVGSGKGDALAGIRTHPGRYEWRYK